MNSGKESDDQRSVIFISHSTEDKSNAELVLGYLRSIGYPDERIFFDSDRYSGIESGREWEKYLFEKLETTACLLVVGTRNWCESKWCFAEAFMAKNRHRTILPLALDKSILKSSVSSVHAIRNFDPTSSESLERLKEALISLGLAVPVGRTLSPGWKLTSRDDDPFIEPFQNSLYQIERRQKTQFSRDNFFPCDSLRCCCCVGSLATNYQ